MPQVDMSLEKLKVYEGKNPRPADFDAFWDKSLAELAAIDPAPVFTKASLACDFADLYELRFTSTKGALIYAKVAVPKKQGKLPTILKFHGLSGNGGPFFDILPYVAQGYVVATMDSRGQGGYSEDVGGVQGTTYTTPFIRGIDGPPEGLLVRDLFLDTAMLARVMMAQDFVDETRVAATGGSQGGALSVACAALVPEIKLCAPNFPYHADYKRVWEMDLDKGAYEGIRYYFRWFDPAHEHEEEFFTKLGYVDIQFLAPRIKAKMQWTTCLMDTTCPPSTQFAAYNKLTCEKEMIIYPDYAHEVPGTHKDLTFAFLSQL
jgi:cephalosporin-C deacetylase